MSAVADRLGAALLALVPAGLRDKAKAVAPGVLTLITVGTEVLSSGTYDKVEVTTTLSGLFATVVAYLVPNRS